MIKGIIGKPGAGKSFYGMRLIVDELRTTQRFIVTNLDINLGNLAEYLHKTYGDTFDLVNRLIRLEEEDVKDFWTFRKDKLDENGKKIAGCFFLIDELQVYFNPRQWATNGGDKGKSCLDYLSRHRHYGDDFFYITQNTNFVEKIFLRLTQDFVMLRNLGKEKWKWFSGPKLFRYYVFLYPPTGVNDKEMETGTFRLDVSGLAECYNTAAHDKKSGVALADKNQKTKGFPFWCFPAGLVLVAIAAIFFLRQVPKGVAIGMRSLTNSADEGFKTSGVIPASPQAPGTNLAEVRETPGVSLEKTEQGTNQLNFRPKQEAATNPVVVNGIAKDLEGKYIIYLSDGNSIRDRKPFPDDWEERQKQKAEVAAVDKTGALVRIGQKYHFFPLAK